MAIERLLESLGPVAFTANGAANGTVTVASTSGFKVKQSIVISAISLPTLTIEVKRVLSPTKMIVGPVVTTGKFLSRQDLSQYTLATSPTIRAEEQPKARLTPNDIIQAVYEQEPSVAIRTVGVDEFGNKWSVSNPIPVVSAGVAKSFDDVILTRDSDGDIILVQKYLAATLIRTQALFYDVNKDLIEVKDV